MNSNQPTPYKSWYQKIVDFFYQEKGQIGGEQKQTEGQPSGDASSIRVFDISKVPPSTIYRPQTSSVGKDWLQLLEIPYERSCLRVPQIRREVIKLYQELCVFIDSSLSEHGESLIRLKSRLDQSNYYYGNVLYTIFCIAEGVITSHYQSFSYDNSFSYDLLKGHTNADFVQSVKDFCLKYEENLPPADDETISTFHLTPNGLQRVWWDEDGIIREKYNLSREQTKLLDKSPYRSTVIMKIPEIRINILLHYLSVMNTLKEQFKSSTGWSKKISKYLNYFFDPNSPWYNYDGYFILAYTLKLCEQTMRENVPYARLLKTDDEVAYLKRVLPKEVASIILEKATNLPSPINLSEETIEALRKQNPTAWKKDIAEFRSTECRTCIKVLNTYRGDDHFKNIAKEAIKLSGTNSVNALLSCYAYFVIVKQDEWEQAVLQKIKKLITHPEQQSAFSDLVSQNKPLNIQLANELITLTKPPVRTVSLDAKKMQAADAEHTEVVKRVSDYLSQNSEDKNDVPSTSSAHPKISVEDLFK